jgi:hypothetical protein
MISSFLIKNLKKTKKPFNKGQGAGIVWLPCWTASELLIGERRFTFFNKFQIIKVF